jgi:hypothetical protein
MYLCYIKKVDREGDHNIDMKVNNGGNCGDITSFARDNGKNLLANPAQVATNRLLLIDYWKMQKCIYYT